MVKVACKLGSIQEGRLSSVPDPRSQIGGVSHGIHRAVKVSGAKCLYSEWLGHFLAILTSEEESQSEYLRWEESRPGVSSDF